MIHNNSNNSSSKLNPEATILPTGPTNSYKISSESFKKGIAKIDKANKANNKTVMK